MPMPWSWIGEDEVLVGDFWRERAKKRRRRKRSHTHCVVYPNGKRALVTMWKGAWRAES